MTWKAKPLDTKKIWLKLSLSREFESLEIFPTAISWMKKRLVCLKFISHRLLFPKMLRNNLLFWKQSCTRIQAHLFIDLYAYRTSAIVIGCLLVVIRGRICISTYIFRVENMKISQTNLNERESDRDRGKHLNRRCNMHLKYMRVTLATFGPAVA